MCIPTFSGNLDNDSGLSTWGRTQRHHPYKKAGSERAVALWEMKSITKSNARMSKATTHAYFRSQLLLDAAKLWALVPINHCLPP